MLKKFFTNIDTCVPIFILVFFCSSTAVVAEENNNTGIENRISATANSGGNVVPGEGTIISGDAKASVEAVNSINDKEEVAIEVEAVAGVQGKDAKASVDVNGQKKSCVGEDAAGCQLEIEVQTNLVEVSVRGKETGELKKIELIENQVEEESITQVAHNFVSNLAQKIISWFQK